MPSLAGALHGRRLQQVTQRMMDRPQRSGRSSGSVGPPYLMISAGTKNTANQYCVVSGQLFRSLSMPPPHVLAVHPTYNHSARIYLSRKARICTPTLALRLRICTRRMSLCRAHPSDVHVRATPISLRSASNGLILDLPIRLLRSNLTYARGAARIPGQGRNQCGQVKTYDQTTYLQHLYTSI